DWTRNMRVLLIIALLTLSTLAQTTIGPSLAPLPRYAYTVTGVVTDGKGNPVFGVFVCASEMDRPPTGRMPCTETKLAGRYELKSFGLAERYVVSAADQPRLLLKKRGRVRPAHTSPRVIIEIAPVDGQIQS